MLALRYAGVFAPCRPWARSQNRVACCSQVYSKCDMLRVLHYQKHHRAKVYGRWWAAPAVVLLVVCGVSVWVLRSPAPSGPAQLIPLYTADASQWTAACSKASNPGHKSLVVANVQQGPGTAVSPAWKTSIDRCNQYGRARVLGYVWTNYGRGGTASIPEIEAQVRAWYALYPGHIGGIFFDGASDTVPGTHISNQPFYHTLTGYVHIREGLGQQVALNFGVNPSSAWMFDTRTEQAANVIVVFEGLYAAGPDRLVAWKPARWEQRYPPYYFAALVHGAYGSAAAPQPASACHTLMNDHVGYVYVGTQYNSLPPYLPALMHDC